VPRYSNSFDSIATPSFSRTIQTSRLGDLPLSRIGSFFSNLTFVAPCFPSRLLAELPALPKGLLTPNRRGKVDQHVLRRIKRAVKKSGVPTVKLHRFRDTFIPNKLRDGVDVRTVQRWAGHEDVNVTMGYAAWLDGQSKAAGDAANREGTHYRKTGTQSG
jgi:hypothetical protein